MKKPAKKIVFTKRISRPLTEEERNHLRGAAEREEAALPPLKPKPGTIGAKLAAARQAKKMTWYAVAKAAGIPNAVTVRNIEHGTNASLENLEAVAGALGMKLDVVECS